MASISPWPRFGAIQKDDPEYRTVEDLDLVIDLMFPDKGGWDLPLYRTFPILSWVEQTDTILPGWMLAKDGSLLLDLSWPEGIVPYNLYEKNEVLEQQIAESSSYGGGGSGGGYGGPRGSARGGPGGLSGSEGVCRNFKQGNCSFGDRCRFSHTTITVDLSERPRDGGNRWRESRGGRGGRGGRGDSRGGGSSDGRGRPIDLGERPESRGEGGWRGGGRGDRGSRGSSYRGDRGRGDRARGGGGRGRCRGHFSPQGCRFGSDCRYSHED